MIQRALWAVHITVFGEQELRELQAAASQRVDALKKAEKKADNEFRPDEASLIRKRLRVWEGNDVDPGILGRIMEQMSIFAPAFSDDGKEPDGQQEMFEGIERKPASTVPVVNIPALKARLILSDLDARVNEEAFDKLDGLTEDDRRRIAYLGRASLELLHTLTPVDLYTLEQVVRKWLEQDNVLDEDEEHFLQGIATRIATDGATLPLYYEPFPFLNSEVDHGTIDLTEVSAESLTEEQYSQLTEAQLQYIIKLSIPQPEPAAELPYQPTAAEKVQEDVLTNTPASDPWFKDTLKQATLWACQRALEITQGLEGHKTREAALRRRIAELTPEAAAEQPEDAPATPEQAEEEIASIGITKAVEPFTEEERQAALEAVTTWSEYRGYCFRYGVALRRIDFEALEDQRRAAADQGRPEQESDLVPAGGSLNHANDPFDDDLL